MADELLRRYKLLGLIGEGTYGRVYKAEFRGQEGQGEVYAIKMIKRNPKGKDSVTSLATLREIKLLRELKHHNVVNLTDVVVDQIQRDVALVMDYACWTLESVVEHHKRNKIKIPDLNLKSMIYQCLKGLEFLHKNWVLHRDLKPQNILLIGDGPKRGTLQLADLGLARIFQSPTLPLSKVDKVVVTLWYRSPELLLGSMHYTTAVDIWSLGCIFMELFMSPSMASLSRPTVPRTMFQGQQLKQGTNFEESQMLKIIESFGVPTNETWDKVEELPYYRDLEKSVAKLIITVPMKTREIGHYVADPAARDLLKQLLMMNPSDRTSATGAIEHEYLNVLLKHEHSFLTNCLDNPKDLKTRLQYELVAPRHLDPPLDFAQRAYEKKNGLETNNKRDYRQIS